MFTLYANDSNLTSYLDIKCKPTRVDEIALSTFEKSMAAANKTLYR